MIPLRGIRAAFNKARQRALEGLQASIDGAWDPHPSGRARVAWGRAWEIRYYIEAGRYIEVELFHYGTTIYRHQNYIELGETVSSLGGYSASDRDGINALIQVLGTDDPPVTTAGGWLHFASQ